MEIPSNNQWIRQLTVFISENRLARGNLVNKVGTHWLDSNLPKEIASSCSSFPVLALYRPCEKIPIKAENSHRKELSRCLKMFASGHWMP